IRDYPPNKDGETWYRASVGGIYHFIRYLEEPIPKEPLKVAFGPSTIRKPVELTPKRDAVVVWAMGGGHGVDLSTTDTVDQAIKRLPWAMVLRLQAVKKDR